MYDGRPLDLGRAMVTFGSMSFNTPRHSSAQATAGTVRLNRRFISIRREAGLTEITDGICRMTNVYEDVRWRLCESLFDRPMFVF